MSESTENIEARVPSEFFEIDSNTIGSKGLLLLANSKVLAYRRDNKETIPYPNIIDLIGGGLNDGETPFETFTREALEEAKLVVTEEMITYASRWPSKMRPGKFAWFVVAQTPYTLKDVVWGNEGQGPSEMSIDDYLEIEDAWPGFQCKTKEWLDIVKQ